MILSRLWILVCVLYISVSYAQQDSLQEYSFPECVISYDPLDPFTVGHSKIKLDSLNHNSVAGQNLSIALRNSGLGQIRSYGVSGAGSVSLRGTGASHSAVLWNGINIESRTLGQADVSRIPVSLADEVSVQLGGATALFGSGAIGGVIQLNNNLSVAKGLELKSTNVIGSFGSFYNGLEIGYSNKKHSLSVLGLVNQSDNDFKYLDPTKIEANYLNREHSSFSNKGWLAQYEYRINKKNELGAKVWVQNNDQDVPASSYSSQGSLAVQASNDLRVLTYWRRKLGFGNLKVKSALVGSDMTYQDPRYGTDSRNRFYSIVNEGLGTIYVRHGVDWLIGMNNSIDLAQVDAYKENIVRNRIAAFTAFKKRWDKLQTSVNFREEIVDDNWSPFSLSWGTQYRLTPSCDLRATISKDYRIPSLNDLYWTGASFGNPDLETEKSIGQELGADLTIAKTTELGITIFNNFINDWIVWTPQTANAWTPENIQKVWSRGLESRVQYNYHWHKIKLGLRANHALIISTNVSDLDVITGDEYAKQLIYTPRNEGALSLRMERKQTSIYLKYIFVGEQFIDEVNDPFYALESYQLVNLHASHSFKMDLGQLDLQGSINNLLGENYSSRRGYPMPGRNYSITINLIYNRRRI